MIELDALTKRYAAGTAVENLSLEVSRGELLVLLGSSGSGKTTTLKMINRLIEPSSGSVRIDGRDTHEQAPHELRRGIGYCFQQVGLFPHLRVGENSTPGVTLTSRCRQRSKSTSPSTPRGSSTHRTKPPRGRLMRVPAGNRSATR